ncbi:serine acetyltransferase [Roseomonas nepalensis]|uniref:Serine acetyltransferase n=1 Tax=Muricoccus nepalensis TaxID=1854500 RepID=A0A502G504_9PROT|nr:serine acetyltransferase [Roseomonas nepalensis]TPG56939.1 serine acetyltransferase [Roseomonas nepalensis]
MDRSSLQSRAAGERRAGWWADYRQDLARYGRGTGHGTGRLPAPLLVLRHRGLQALLQYRIAHAVFRSALPGPLRAALLMAMVAWQKAVEVATRISIPYRASIGPGLLLGHPGNIFVGAEAAVGPMCTLHDGVTLGVSGRGAQRGSPVLGESVTVGERAVLVGRITVGRGARIAPGSLVSTSVPEGAAVAGNPGRLLAGLARCDRPATAGAALP